MDSKTIQMPREVHIGPDVIYETGEISKNLRLPGEPLVVTGYKTLNIAGKLVYDSLEDAGFNPDIIQVKGATEESVKQVENKLTDNSFVLGVGGGKVIDVAKMASTNNNSYFISIPTTASHDGIASPMASIKNEKGSVSKKAQAPMALIADSEIIKNAPFRFLASGCADIVSNYTAVKDWRLAKRLQNVSFSESAAALSLMTAKLIIDSSDSIKEGLELSARLVVKMLFSSGMAISIAGSSRPASGSEHLFSHALDKVAKKPALHGEQCGIGTIMMMNLHGGDWKFIKNALESMKAPTTCYDIGIDPEDIIDALTMAHTIRPERYTILGDRGLSREAAYQLAIKTGVI
ncbi:MAG: NAD(P)-dependent glycerol-1-phosphate dehydrogenase [Methanobrevibacter wolinii]|uniref:NAD(P)-dependent glycerol-1-phosphate dehydrogenase n=1 Tax=Methanobrevibacter wolinii TaxID=190977 RepID=UPI0005B2B1D5|nr:NAD(P)-dependent glycerol-1-phosphate dehydrogenase [Methanobrevibacter wolinii]MDD5959481.1 NAD(P)-dependent glycerol-1-phosphate dehydrogenase [Methanobrevibacter wolinii]